MSAPAPGGGPDGLRVGLICPYSWDGSGGVKAHVQGLAAGLRNLGIEADVLAPGSRGLEDAVWLGSTVGIRSNGSVGHVALGPTAAARTARAISRGRYDLLHVHEPICPAVGLAALAAARVPVVGTFHRYSEGRGWYGPFLPVCRWGMGRLDARIAVSEAARSFVERSAPGEYHIIPNGIDVAALQPRADQRRGERLLFIGRAEPRKGLPVLLAAMERLRPSVHLDLVGTSDDDLIRLGVTIPEGVRARVTAHGAVDDAERLRIMGRADVLAVPSVSGESFGIVIAEGMAAGLPVVASRIAGYVDVLSEDCGRLVPPGNPGELAAALAGLLADGELRRRMAAAGRERAWRYDWATVARQVAAVYASAVDGRVGETVAARRRRAREVAAGMGAGDA